MRTRFTPRRFLCFSVAGLVSASESFASDSPMRDNGKVNHRLVSFKIGYHIFKT